MTPGDELPVSEEAGDGAPLNLEPGGEHRLRRRVTIAVTVAALLTALLGVLSWQMSRLASQDADQVVRTYQASRRLQLALRHADDVETGVRGFALTGLDTFLQPYESGKKGLARDMEQLPSMITDSPLQSQRMMTLKSEANSRLQAANAVVTERRRSGKLPSIPALLQGKQVMDSMRATVHDMDVEERHLLDERTQRTEARRRITSSAIGFGSFMGVIFLVVAGIVIRRGIMVAASAETEVRALNADLDLRVRQRTAALEAEALARRETEARLSASEESFRALLDGISDYAIYMLDTEGNVASWNSGAARITGYTADEILGRHISSFHPAGSGYRQHAEESLAKAAHTGRSEEEALRMRKDGSTFWAHAVITSLYGADGTLNGYSKVMRDISARKQSDERLRNQAQLLELAHDAIIVRDLEARIVFWNHGAELMYGWSAEEAIGKPVHTLLQTVFPGALADVEKRLSSEGEWEGELHHTTRSGAAIIVTSRMSSQRDEQGAPAATMEINRDITDRKRVEEVLREQEHLLTQSQRIAHIGSWTFRLADPERKLVWSDELYLMYGVNRESFRPTVENLIQRVLVEDRAALQGWIEDCAAGRRPGELEFRMQMGDGSIRYFSRRGGLEYDSDNQPVRITGTTQDITDRKRAENELRESEERFQTMVNGIPQLAWMADVDGSIFWYNQRWYEYTGTTFAAMEGWGWQSVHHPDMVAKVTERYAQATQAGELFEMEFPLRGADGNYRTFLTRGTPLKDPMGRVIRWFGTNTDITERKQNEERLVLQAEELARSRQELDSNRLLLQSILDSLEEGLVATDDQGKFILWNPAATKIVGMGREDLAPDSWAEHYGSFLPDMVTKFPSEQHPLVRAVAGETSSAVMYINNPTLNRGVWIEINGAPLRDLHGKSRGGVIAFRDITKKKADELEIRKLNEDLEERIALRTAQLETANKELQAFTYSVSHDLRAPLRHINGFARILISDFGDTMAPEVKSYLGRIQDAVLRMGLLVDGLLGLAKLGRQSMKIQPNELNTIVEQVVAMMQPECEGRDVEWRVATLPIVECDRILVGQIFQNLVGNALKYSRGRSKAIIEIDSIQEEGKPTVIFVRDNGAGFNMQYATKLFEVFQRMHTESEFEGTGVGLATVHRIIQKHGGSVWAEAEMDRGATFFFTLGASESMRVAPSAVAAGV